MSGPHHRHSVECDCQACEAAEFGIFGQIRILEGGEPNTLAYGEQALLFLQTQRSERQEVVS